MRNNLDLQTWFYSMFVRNSPRGATGLARKSAKFPWGGKLKAFMVVKLDVSDVHTCGQKLFRISFRPRQGWSSYLLQNSSNSPCCKKKQAFHGDDLTRWNNVNLVQQAKAAQRKEKKNTPHRPRQGWPLTGRCGLRGGCLGYTFQRQLRRQARDFCNAVARRHCLAMRNLVKPWWSKKRCEWINFFLFLPNDNVVSSAAAVYQIVFQHDPHALRHQPHRRFVHTFLRLKNTKRWTNVCSDYGYGDSWCFFIHSPSCNNFEPYFYF